MIFYPLEIGREAWGSTLTPSWNITEQKAASGRRRAVCEQYYPSWKIKLNYKALTDDEVNTLLGFYNARRGGFEPFYYKDYAYYKITAQTLNKSVTGVYPLVANIGGALEPVAYVDRLTVYVDGVKTTNYTLNNGAISINTTGVVTADYEYYFKVHFTDALSITQVFENCNNVSVTLESVR